jgi:hypothetical protein
VTNIQVLLLVGPGDEPRLVSVIVPEPVSKNGRTISDSPKAEVIKISDEMMTSHVIGTNLSHSIPCQLRRDPHMGSNHWRLSGRSRRLRLPGTSGIDRRCLSVRS